MSDTDALETQIVENGKREDVHPLEEAQGYAALMKQAKRDMNAGRTDNARKSLAKIVQQYPRTDAAAAATVALVKLADDDRDKLQRELDALKREQSRQTAAINQVQNTIDEVKNAPPKTIVVEKTVPAKKAPVRRKRRRR